MTPMHIDEERLNDYVDGLLPPGGEEAVAAHLAECAACRREAERLRALLAGLAALPLALPPGEDLRPAIRARIGAARARPLPAGAARRAALLSLRWPLAAAALLLVVLSSSLTLLLVRGRGEPAAPVAPVAAAPATPAQAAALREFRDAEAEYVRATTELLRALRRERDSLDPAAAAHLESSLRAIDAAIREASAALHHEPGSELLRQVLRTSYERKLEVLRRASRLGPAS